MTQESRDEELLGLLREFLNDRGVDAAFITPATPLVDLGVNSLHAITLAFAFEDRYGIEVPLDRFRAETVGDAIAFFKALLAAR